MAGDAQAAAGQGGRLQEGAAADSDEAKKWKRLALTKKETLTVKATIPKRQFMGDSKELVTAVTSIIETEVSKLFELK